MVLGTPTIGNAAPRGAAHAAPSVSVAADHHQRVDAEASHIVLDALDAGAAWPVLFEWIGPRRAENGPPAWQDAPHGRDVERHRVRLERSAPAITEADELDAVILDPASHNGPDHRVQPRTVAAAGKDSHSHTAKPSRQEASCNGCGKLPVTNRSGYLPRHR